MSSSSTPDTPDPSQANVDLELLPEPMKDFDLVDTQINLSQMLERSLEEIELLYARAPVMVKRNLPVKKAAAYMQRFGQAGARLRAVRNGIEVDIGPAPAIAFAPLDTGTFPNIVEAQQAAEQMAREAAAAEALEAEQRRLAEAARAAEAALNPPLALAPEPETDRFVSEMKCPKCFTVQPRRTLCVHCGADMGRLAAAQIEAQRMPARAVDNGPELPAMVKLQAALPSGASRMLFGSDDHAAWFSLSFAGRIGRLRFIAWAWPASTAAFFFGLFSLTTASRLPLIGLILFSLVALMAVVYYLRLAALRLHDLGLSGWFALVLLVPYLNLVAALALMIAPGKKEENRFGELPPGNTQAVYAGAVLMTLANIGAFIR